MPYITTDTNTFLLLYKSICIGCFIYICIHITHPNFDRNRESNPRPEGQQSHTQQTTAPQRRLTDVTIIHKMTTYAINYISRKSL